MSGNHRSDVNIPHPVSIGHAEGFITDIRGHSFEPPTGHGPIAGIDDRDTPWLGMFSCTSIEFLSMSKVTSDM